MKYNFIIYTCHIIYIDCRMNNIYIEYFDIVDILIFIERRRSDLESHLCALVVAVNCA